MVMPTALSKLGTTVVVIYFDYHGGPMLVISVSYLPSHRVMSKPVV
jgi:hypothetical protein